MPPETPRYCNPTAFRDFQNAVAEIESWGTSAENRGGQGDQGELEVPTLLARARWRRTCEGW